MAKLNREFAADKLKNDLKFQISNDLLPPGSPVLSSPVLSKKYHLSPLTVHRALAELKEKGWVYRIQGKGTFVAPRKIDAQYIGLLIPNITNPEFPEIAQEFIKQAEEKGRRIIIGEGSSNPARERRFYEELNKNNIKEVLKFPNTLPVEEETRKKMKEFGFRVVMVNDFWFDGGEFSSAKIDESSGTRQALQHLVNLGHKDICYFDYKKETRKDCLNTYRSVISEKSLKEHLVLFGKHTEKTEKGIQAVFDSGVTAVFTPYDVHAIEILRQARKNKVLVPGKLSIVGFGDIETASNEEISLTTLSYSKKELAEESLRLLLNGSTAIKKVTIEPTLIVRGSTGPCTKG